MTAALPVARLPQAAGVADQQVARRGLGDAFSRVAAVRGDAELFTLLLPRCTVTGLGRQRVGYLVQQRFAYLASRVELRQVFGEGYGLGEVAATTEAALGAVELKSPLG